MKKEVLELKTSELKTNLINEINILKNSHWVFGIKSQNEWFKKKVINKKYINSSARNISHRLKISKWKFVSKTTIYLYFIIFAIFVSCVYFLIL